MTESPSRPAKRHRATDVGLDALPPELIVAILCAAGPLGAARMRRVARAFDGPGAESCAIMRKATLRSVRAKTESCTVAVVRATIRCRDDAGVRRLERLLAARGVDLNDALSPEPDFNDPQPTWWVAASACKIGWRFHPVDDGITWGPISTRDRRWAPLDVAVAVGAPHAIALLASMGARPRHGLCALLVDHAVAYGGTHIIVTRNTRHEGTKARRQPWPRREAPSKCWGMRPHPTAAVVDALLCAYPSLAHQTATDHNPLTATQYRARAVLDDAVYALRSAAELCLAGERTDRVLDGLPAHARLPMSDLLAAFPWACLSALPKEDVATADERLQEGAARQAAIARVAHCAVDTSVAFFDWRSTARSLLRAGFDPLDRISPTATDTKEATAVACHRDMLAKADALWATYGPEISMEPLADLILELARVILDDAFAALYARHRSHG